MKSPNGYGSVFKMSGKRRKPYMVRITNGWEFDPVKEKQVQKYIIVGYASTRAEGQQMLADYHRNPFDTKLAKLTFQDVYEYWSKSKFPTISKSNIHGYEASYNACGTLYNKPFRDIKLADLQYVIDSCNKNFPTLKKIKTLFNQLYKYAMQNDICIKDYSTYVDVLKHSDKNPDKRDHNKFTRSEVDKLWTMKDEPFIQIVLMLIYNGCRITEFLDLKKENVNLEEQYFDVIASKTKSGIRRVPIADKVLPFYKSWYESSDCEYLLHTPDNEHFAYWNYHTTYWNALMENIGLDHNPHDTRHTCISMLAEAHVDPTMIKSIVGHSGAMSLTEKVYTHLDVKALLEAINQI